MDRKALIFISLLLSLNIAAAQNSNPLGEVLWYIGFGVGLIILAFVSETAYRIFSSLYAGGSDLIPAGGRIDYKEDLRTRKKVMGQIGSAERKREDEWEKAQRMQTVKNLFRLMIYKNNIKLSDAAKELGVDIVSMSRAAFDLKQRGLIEITGDGADPNLKATKLLLDKVRPITL